MEDEGVAVPHEQDGAGGIRLQGGTGFGADLAEGEGFLRGVFGGGEFGQVAEDWGGGLFVKELGFWQAFEGWAQGSGYGFGGGGAAGSGPVGVALAVERFVSGRVCLRENGRQVDEVHLDLAQFLEEAREGVGLQTGGRFRWEEGFEGQGLGGHWNQEQLDSLRLELVPEVEDGFKGIGVFAGGGAGGGGGGGAPEGGGLEKPDFGGEKKPAVAALEDGWGSGAGGRGGGDGGGEGGADKRERTRERARESGAVRCDANQGVEGCAHEGGKGGAGLSPLQESQFNLVLRLPRFPALLYSFARFRPSEQPPERQMVFSSQLFIFYFLPVSLAVYYLLAGASQKIRNLWLVLTGYLFYGWAEPRFIALMFATTSLDWALSLVIARDRWDFWRGSGPVECVPRREAGQEASPTRRRALFLSVASNLCALGFFKYFNFAVDSWNGVMHAAGWEAAVVQDVLRVVLPLGISFYTFQALSYIIDVYRGDAEAMEDFVDFSCFVSMFPHLVAGPILKFSFLAEQLRQRTVSLDKVARGAAFFWMGLGKKVLLANPCGRIADGSFEAAGRGFWDAWVGAVAYALQIYFDFSGYSDMAIGLGLLFGFYFARNFNAPYRSVSVTDFWRRWHISLSSWLREYLYIPLGGNRRGALRTHVNLFVTMVLGGLWHGASWNFVLWGVLHGGALVVERVGAARWAWRVPRWVGVGWTLAVVLVGWVLFRSPDMAVAWEYLRAMAGMAGGGVDGSVLGAVWRQPYLGMSFAVALGVAGFGVQTWDWTQRLSIAKAVVVVGVGSLALVALLTQDYNPFIYFIF